MQHKTGIKSIKKITFRNFLVYLILCQVVLDSYIFRLLRSTLPDVLTYTGVLFVYLHDRIVILCLIIRLLKTITHLFWQINTSQNWSCRVMWGVIKKNKMEQGQIILLQNRLSKHNFEGASDFYTISHKLHNQLRGWDGVWFWTHLTSS